MSYEYLSDAAPLSQPEVDTVLDYLRARGYRVTERKGTAIEVQAREHHGSRMRLYLHESPIAIQFDVSPPGLRNALIAEVTEALATVGRACEFCEE